MQPNILLIVMDSVRASNTSLHGYHRETTPFLDGFASEKAVKFESAYAPAEWSLPSHVSMFTGYHAIEHGVTGEKSGVEPGHSIFEKLNDSGYATGLFTENPHLAQLDTGLERGFETVYTVDDDFEGPNPTDYGGQKKEFVKQALRDGTPLRSLYRGMVSKVGWNRPDLVPNQLLKNIPGITFGDIYADGFLSWQRATTQPWAACINLMDAHYPYKPVPEYNEWDDGVGRNAQNSLSSAIMDFYTGKVDWSLLDSLEPLYDGAIRQADAIIERIISTLQVRDSLKNTLVIDTSDHGETFGESCSMRDVRLVGHNLGADESNLHIPLVVKPAGHHVRSDIVEPVSITHIPDLISSSSKSESSALGEMLEGKVLAHTTGFWDSRLEEISNAGVDTSPYEDEMLIRYTAGTNGLIKEVSWRNKFWKYEGNERLHVADSTQFDNVFDNLKDSELKRPRHDSIDEKLEKQLENLGYR